MPYPTINPGVRNLRHRTYPRLAFIVATSGVFHTGGHDKNYDAGANFLGVLGQKANHQIGDRTATLVCTWCGSVTNPLPYDAYDVHTPDVLHDFDGSGNHFDNEDPRYFLPNGSSGLVLEGIEFDGNSELLEGWCLFRSGVFSCLFNLAKRPEWVTRCLLFAAKRQVTAINSACKAGKIRLRIVPPMLHYSSVAK